MVMPQAMRMVGVNDQGMEGEGCGVTFMWGARCEHWCQTLCVIHEVGSGGGHGGRAEIKGANTMDKQGQLGGRVETTMRHAYIHAYTYIHAYIHVWIDGM